MRRRLRIEVSAFRLRGGAAGTAALDCARGRDWLRERRGEQANARILTSSGRAVVAGAVVVALAACGWFAAALPPFGVEANAVTFSVAAAMLAMGAALPRRPASDLRGRWPNPDQPPVPVAARALARAPADAARDSSLRVWGLIAWLLAALFAGAVELWELFHAPRSAYPTLSSLANEVLGPGHRVARAVAFMCWGACGLFVARRPWRRA